ncbi:hypothetical protein QBC37DRAFT_285056 [Rhypophila decipiens]|uniref:NmrA-like domain-containing protein n=1 Tax=Rhypophila decipiens TaxID=261697 RepID=A0AAN7B8F1_9PEZI|nr:hypothetical protein QBC37DRAFT_285056 [Rhypophila decipiens]
MNKNPRVFVLSATGSQGGEVCQQLRQLEWNVHATVRNPDSPSAQALVESGVQVSQGDWDDHQALGKAMTGCDKLFLCLLPSPVDQDLERVRAEAITRIAKDVGISQVVASTTLGVFLHDRNEHVQSGSFMEKHLAAKKGLEDAVEHARFAHWTLLHPALFMANFLEPKVSRAAPSLRDHGFYKTATTPDTRLALVDHQDIARLAVFAFQHPAKLHGQAVGIASELLTPHQIMDELGEAAGRQFKATYLTDEEIAAQGVNSMAWMRHMPEYVAMDEVEKLVPLTKFRDFLEREKDIVAATYPRSE